MKLEMKRGHSLCYLPVFKINDIEADENDFGVKEDIDPEHAEEYGCGNMQFIPKEAAQYILDKYKITKEEYEIICEKLDCLSFGACGWCV